MLRPIKKTDMKRLVGSSPVHSCERGSIHGVAMMIRISQVSTLVVFLLAY